MRILMIAVMFGVLIRFPAPTVGAEDPTRHRSSAIPEGRPPLTPCRVTGIDFEARCATFEVFENRESRRGRRINLRVVVLPARTAAKAPDPLFVLAGGPGQAATEIAGLVSRMFDSVLGERDIVLVDQRGTGGPDRLGGTFYGPDPQSCFGDRFPVEGVNRCRREWERRADLRFYVTPAAMDDLDDVREALGYERINLFGGSYGTRAALVYMGKYPERVRSAILKNVVDFDLSAASDTERALTLLLDDCAADEACRRAFPNLKDEYRSVLNRLDREAVAVELTDPETNKTATVAFTKRFLLSILRNILQSTALSSRLPVMIHQAFQGDFKPLAETGLRLRRGISSTRAVGVALAVFCGEDAVLSRNSALGPDTLGTVCRHWPKAVLPRGYGKLAQLRTPVLMITGFLDPSTPPRMAENVMRFLPNGRNVVIRNASHYHNGLAPCIDEVMADFLRAGSAKGLDTSCVDLIRRPPFVTGYVPQ